MQSDGEKVKLLTWINVAYLTKKPNIEQFHGEKVGI